MEKCYRVKFVQNGIVKTVTQYYCEGNFVEEVFLDEYDYTNGEYVVSFKEVE